MIEPLSKALNRNSSCNGSTSPRLILGFLFDFSMLAADAFILGTFTLSDSGGAPEWWSDQKLAAVLRAGHAQSVHLPSSWLEELGEGLPGRRGLQTVAADPSRTASHPVRNECSGSTSDRRNRPSCLPRVIQMALPSQLGAITTLAASAIPRTVHLRSPSNQPICRWKKFYSALVEKSRARGQREQHFKPCGTLGACFFVFWVVPLTASFTSY